VSHASTLSQPKQRYIAVCTLIKHTHAPGCVAAQRAATQQTVLNALAKRYVQSLQWNLIKSRSSTRKEEVERSSGA
jgi:hypothetical protein